MKPKDLINYKQLSLLVAGNEYAIRKDRCPKKYREKVKEIEDYIQYFISKHENKI